MSGVGRSMFPGSGGGGRHRAEVLGDRYRLVERLGAGGMSVVWRGYDEVLGRPVAVKVLASELASARGFRHRIRIEAQAAARLSHPHITNVYDYGETTHAGAPVPYVVMELVDGESLATWLGRSGRLPWRSAVTASAQVAAALASAHARGVVHRDVTPGNIMLTAVGAKVVDFGISALVGERDIDPDGHLLGTPAYLAPERLDGGEVSPAADVYALGVLLYRTLTGALPWPARTTTELLHAHQNQDPEPMSPVPGLPESVTDLARRCLAKSPEQRPTSAEVATTLADAVGVALPVPVSPAPVGDGPDTAGGLATVGTTILPWSTDTDALPISVRRRRREARRSRLEVAAVGVGLVAVTGGVWAATADSPADTTATASRADLAMATPATCRAEYTVRRDAGRTFDAELTLTNLAAQPVRNWTLTFSFPGDQALSQGSSGWRQEGREVTREPAGDGTAELLPGGSTKVTLSGTYAGANPLPVEFRMGGERCEVQVSGLSGEVTDTGGVAAGAQPPVSPTTADQTGGGASGGRDKPTDKGKDKGKGDGDRSGKGGGRDDDGDDD